MNDATPQPPMTRRLRRAAALVFLASSIAAGAVYAQNGKAANEHWVGTWTTAVVPRPSAKGSVAPPFRPPAAPAANAPAPDPLIDFNNQTIRQIVRTSIGGSQVRVELSNRFGSVPLAIGGAHVALREKEASIVAGTDRVLTFGGSAGITIPAGAVVVSDAAALKVPPRADLAIDLYVPGDTSASPSPMTMHRVAVQTSYVSPAGNHLGAATLPIATTTQNWYLLSRVDVLAPSSMGAIVTFGDSITDGTRSTPDTNNRWPNHLAARLADKAGQPRLAVLNAAISGNRVLSEAAPALGVNALARFDYDALLQPGVRYVVVLEGINDFGMARNSPSPTADDMIAAHKQLIDRAHARGLKIYGATLLPYEGAAYFTPEGEAKRKAVNEWLRTAKPYDGLIDFEAVVRDPEHPTKFLAKFNSGDNLHPNDAGYAAMANAVDLSLFAK